MRMLIIISALGSPEGILRGNIELINNTHLIGYYGKNNIISPGGS